MLDYGDNFIYPGFLESHCHGYFAGDRAIGQADLSGVVPTDYDKYREIIGDFIRKNPGREVYMAAGWTETDQYVSKAHLDGICSDKPLIMNTGGGHSMPLNTKALEWRGYDAEHAKRMGPELVHVDENGEPDGYVSEMAAISVVDKLPSPIEQAKGYLLAWQDMTLANGFTAVADVRVGPW